MGDAGGRGRRVDAPCAAREFHGVQATASHKWKAELCHLGKRLYLGTWGTEEEAARAYDAKCRALGLFSRLNFPEERHEPAAALAARTSASVSYTHLTLPTILLV